MTRTYFYKQVSGRSRGTDQLATTYLFFGLLGPTGGDRCVRHGSGRCGCRCGLFSSDVGLLSRAGFLGSYWLLGRGSRSGFCDGDGSSGDVVLGFWCRSNRNRSCGCVTVRSLEKLEADCDWFLLILPKDDM